MSNTVIRELARATGVDEADVAKVLNKLGLDKCLPEATKVNEGVEPGSSQARIGFRLGKSTIII